ncbi:HEPN domain-containing protein [Pectobacterium betavasculorum]|uniref:HEPN domain-containing protein n=1 Tax=Pectobacterium betavasculorum TaxID=55207 RepID=UPI000AF8415E|nr:HEPN domain-containing protein [Pectobacterium betavasculorum]
MTPILSQIVHLTKSILLISEDPSKHPAAQFFPGKHSPFSFPTGIVLTWWYNKDMFNVRESLVNLIIQEFPYFKDCDPETCSETIIKTLQEICTNRDIFDTDAVCFSKKRSLFDCRIIPVTQYAKTILSATEENINILICRRCTIYLVPRFQITSFYLIEDSIHAIAKNDRKYWNTLIDKGFLFNGWTPENPIIAGRQDRTFMPQNEFTCLLVSEENGTQEGTKFSSSLKFRKFLSILFSSASKRAKYSYHKSMAQSADFCIQFPHCDNIDQKITRSNIGSLTPFYASQIPIGPDEITEIKNWYNRLSICSLQSKDRIEKCAHFLNRGMNSDDIEAYINYFVALDALFGQRGTVEQSILSGVKALGIDPKFSEKASWLFDLRNELVHGGSRYIKEWPKYQRYIQHFHSTPFNDVKNLSQLAILHAPYTFSQ